MQHHPLVMVSSGDRRSEAGGGQAASENSSGDELKLGSRNQEQERVELERYCLSLMARGSQTSVLFPFYGRLCPWVFKKFIIYFGHAGSLRRHGCVQMWYAGLVVVYGILVPQRSNPGPLDWELGVLSTGPPGKSLLMVFKRTWIQPPTPQGCCTAGKQKPFENKHICS